MKSVHRLRWAGYLVGVFAAIVAGLLGIALPVQAGMLVVGDLSNNTINLFDSDTGSLLKQTLVPSVSGNAGAPKGIAFGPDGTLYVADQANGVIDRFDPASGDYIGQFVTGGGPGALFAPSGIAFGPDGNLYVADFGNSNLSFINIYGGPNSATPGQFVGQFVAPGVGPPGGLFAPGGIVFQGGNLYVADSDNGSIDEFDGTTGDFTAFVPAGNPPSPLANPQNLAFDPLGNLYVTDVTNNVVYQYDAAGGYLGEFVDNSGGLSQPIGLAFGPDGNLYVSDSLGRVAAFNGMTGASLPDLVGAGFLTDPQYLAFGSVAGVPEPSTFVMITFALAGVLWFGRRRSSLSL